LEQREYTCAFSPVCALCLTQNSFSGAAWAYSGDPDSIEIVTNWEAEYSHCRDVEKTPSRLYYNRNNIVSCWGNGAKGRKGAKPISWFKLLLLDDEDVPSDIAASYQFREAKKLQQAMGKNAVELAGDYLRKIWEHTLLSIERAVGRELMGQCSFHVTITVPAVWPPYAHHRVRKAISYAGIPTLRDGRNVSFGLITEPEAAALATIKDMGKRSNVKVRQNASHGRGDQ
jgi:molecular chaperone DnaK (HSP70)